ncbi:MAG: cyclic nucleotide-binding domain-containing protein [Pseudomonadota bacterium]
MSLINECDQLQTIELFRGLENAKCKLVAMSSDRLVYQRGNPICRQGEASDAVFFVLSGSVRIVRESEDRSVLIGVLSGGTVIGETGVIRGVGRNSTIIAAEETTVLKMDGRVFMELLQTVPQMALALARVLAARLDETNERVLAVAGTSADDAGAAAAALSAPPPTRPLTESAATARI